MKRLALQSTIRLMPTLRMCFSSKKPSKPEETDTKSKFDRRSEPDLSEFDKVNMEEIRKQTKDTSEPFKVQQKDRKLLTDRPTKLNLKQFELLKASEMPDDSGLNRPKGVMDFMDHRFDNKDGILQVLGIYSNSLIVSGIQMRSGAIIFPRQLFTWEINKPEDIRDYHFNLLNIIKPKPGKRYLLTKHTLSLVQAQKNTFSTTSLSRN